MVLTDELADRIHRVSIAQLRDLCEFASSLDPLYSMQDMQGGLACFAGEGSPLTQLCHFGHRTPVADLTEAEGFFGSRCGQWEVNITPFASAAAFQSLGTHGYIPSHFETVMALEIGDVPAPTHDVEEVPPGDDGWMLASERGWRESDAISAPGETTRILAGSDASRYFSCQVNEEIAATASVFVSDGIALFSGAATRPSFRSQGLQYSLLAHRLRLGGKGNLAIMVAIPGSASHRNAQRIGFQPLYSKMIFMRHSSGGTDA